MSLLKGAIELADRIVTVSPSYADEILTAPGGWGLEEQCVRRHMYLEGVLNGIDTAEWDPSTDVYLSACYQGGRDNHFSARDMSGKLRAKHHVQRAFGLIERDDMALLVFVGRLVHQKGVDLIAELVPWLMSRDHAQVTGRAQLIVLGRGDDKYERLLLSLQHMYAGRFVCCVAYSKELEHQLIAAADMLLMPSRYEPCGLPQMYALRYGTVPVVHATGGLRDSVIHQDPLMPLGTGWKFHGVQDCEAFKGALWSALKTYLTAKDSWRTLTARCMVQDFSWGSAARRWASICASTLALPSYIA